MIFIEYKKLMLKKRNVEQKDICTLLHNQQLSVLHLKRNVVEVHSLLHARNTSANAPYSPQNQNVTSKTLLLTQRQNLCTQTSHRCEAS